jgi:hypothetical protein
MGHYFGLTTRSNRIQGRATEFDPVVFGVAGDCGPNWSVNLADEIDGTNNAYGWACAPRDAAQPGADTLVIRRVAEDAAGVPVPDTLYVQSARFQDGQLFVGPAVPPGFVPATSQTHRLVVSGYYVNQNSVLDTPGNAVPSLRVKRLAGGAAGVRIIDDEVLPFVEDLQIQFGVDTDAFDTPNRGAIDRYVNPGDPILDPLSPAFIPTAEVLAVRIWVRVRADRDERGFVDNTNYVYADQNVVIPPPLNQFRRVVVSKTIYLRNARPPV